MLLVPCWMTYWQPTVNISRCSPEEPTMIIVGVDGGGSKTSALAVDENGTVIGRGLGGPSKYHTIGLAKALGVVADATRQALDGHHADMAGVFLAFLRSSL